MLEKFPDAILKEDDSGRIPLHYAAHIGNVDVVELFLQKNDSLAYKPDKEGMSALHSSVKKGNGGVMRTIIKRYPGACELLDKKSRTALHLAVESGSINAVKILLKELAFGDLINEQDEDGNTAFHLAAINRHYTILAMLAHDRRVDKLAMNGERMIVADIVQLDNQLLRLEKVIPPKILHSEYIYIEVYIFWVKFSILRSVYISSCGYLQCPYGICAHATPNSL